MKTKNLIFLGILYHAQDNLLFHPELPAHSRVFVPVPTMQGLPYENVNIKTIDNMTLHAFWIRHPGEKVNNCTSIGQSEIFN